MRAATDHELIHFARRGSTDQRIMFKDADRLDNFADASDAVVDFVLGKVVEDALKVFCDFQGKLDSRHRQLARQLLCGGAAYFFAGNLVFQVALHVRPGDRPAGCDDG